MQGQPDHPRGPTSQNRDAAADADRAHRAALEREDDVVQQLVVAKYALSIGRAAEAMEAIDSALSLARHSLSQLLPTTDPTGPSGEGSPSRAGYAGRLVRSTATGTGPDQMYAEPLSVVPRQIRT